MMLKFFGVDTLIFTSLGREFTIRGTHFPANTQDKQHMVRFLTKLPELIRTHAIKPNPTKLLTGGLDGIGGGMLFMDQGRNSGEKIVYRLK